MKRILTVITGMVAVAVIFSAGAFASVWMNFNGNDQIDNSDSHVAEIMDILRATNEGKLSAEESERLMAEELELYKENNPPGLVNKISELEDEIEQLKTDNAGLATDLNAKQDEINDKQSQIEALQNERDGLQTQIDELQTIIDNFDDNSDYVQHLEEQLSIANQKADEHHNVTESAVNEAREISGGDE